MNSYLLFKSLHFIAVISWIAGLLYLPRIFVYHVENKEKKEATEIFEVMARPKYNKKNFNLLVESGVAQVGEGAGNPVTDGKYNTLIGRQVGEGLTTGDSNVLIGYNAGNTGNGGDGGGNFNTVFDADYNNVSWQSRYSYWFVK